MAIEAVNSNNASTEVSASGRAVLRGLENSFGQDLLQAWFG
jgi:hypothetical protein